MRVLCCLDGTNGGLLCQAVSTFLKEEGRTVGVLYVTDTGPREEMGRHRERFLRPAYLPLSRSEQMRQVELASAREILEEGSRLLGGAERLLRSGRPEQIIVQMATEWQANMLIICSRSLSGASPLHGPRSIGHVARFVLDHAPCPVLLVR